ncbi:N-acetylgalactosaminyltransferase 7-like [Gigantopelta aegis]|uniref:N-acetylgalactosaminyltransferase 7-like n=1 Tax=Gigantopelta aegis TaxID=1735272 RepID=UPI001B88ADDC|nr:N-acetylgalactosaminyltransferase 7-like [Gigantopelta aegis]
MYTFLRRKIFLKFGILMICLLLLGPYMFSVNIEKQSDVFNRLAHDTEQEHDSVYVQDWGKADKSANETKSAHQVVYGPSAVFKDNILGNYEPPREKGRTGPGEYGEGVITPDKDARLVVQSDREYGYNMLASDQIALDRVPADLRLDECKYWHYPESLPTSSVIIVVFNEGWSPFLRTVHSVINTSPQQLLTEVIIIDDFSDKEHFGAKLENYIKRWSGKVKLYRNTKRKGLIQSRTAGAMLATGDVIIFLDAHCECESNWLPPLLSRIAYDRTIVAVPIVDSIDWKTFRFKSVYRKYNLRGLFEWGFFYKEGMVPPVELSKRKLDSEPYWSPTHAGGLLAMDRRYFLELGAYDPGLEIWGGENFELSFKVWMCGGSVEWVPCSRVGHVYKHHVPPRKVNINTKIHYTKQNYLRIVEVWMDGEYKDYFYTIQPWLRGYPVTNISKQLQMKKDKNCKSFKWFMENIAYDVFYKFPAPPRNKAWGKVKLKHDNVCWNTRHSSSGNIIYRPCMKTSSESELFRLNVDGQIGNGELCITAHGGKLDIGRCRLPPSGPWEWREETGAIFHKKEKKCVEPSKHFFLELKPCNPENRTQQWNFIEVYPWKDK